MLPPATLDAVTRLATTLMTLVGVVADVAKAGGTYTFSEAAAHSVVHRLARLVAALIALATDGPTRRRKQASKNATKTIQSNAKPAPPTPAAPTTPNPLRTEDWRLKTERGWLLKALPDTAPAIAAEIATLLADPALAELLATEPGLLRTLNPLLRSLGLAAPLPAPPPDPAPPPTPSPQIHPDRAAPICNHIQFQKRAA